MALLPKLKAELAHVQRLGVRFRSFPKTTKYACGKMLSLVLFLTPCFFTKLIQINVSQACCSSHGFALVVALSYAAHATRVILLWTEVLPSLATALTAKHGSFLSQFSTPRQFKCTSKRWNHY
jgi:hypothetical protein